jgi:hypothetical protein
MEDPFSSNKNMMHFTNNVAQKLSGDMKVPCTHCDSLVSINVNFCNSCGAPVRLSGSLFTQQQKEASVQNSPPRSPPRHSSSHAYEDLNLADEMGESKASPYKEDMCKVGVELNICCL